ncbi:hypothetical protein TNCV_4370011 [Trichonephila clavipes]|nr:hypothetical protein TNCV_4370011 [Trichonephila clavipes]
MDINIASIGLKIFKTDGRLRRSMYNFCMVTYNAITDLSEGKSEFSIAWDVEGMLLVVVVVVSRRVHASKGVNIDTVDEESALLDEEDAAEVDKLLDVAGAVSIKEMSG